MFLASSLPDNQGHPGLPHLQTVRCPQRNQATCLRNASRLNIFISHGTERGQVRGDPLPRVAPWVHPITYSTFIHGVVPLYHEEPSSLARVHRCTDGHRDSGTVGIHVELLLQTTYQAALI